ncbi:cornifelin homolog B-like [Latimeria chalumnae]|uniref:cornifelin homolog B-like n=1 Tax=Latimeria chalumnae TaxID=7897 RepID=UPI00313DDFE7
MSSFAQVVTAQPTSSAFNRHTGAWKSGVFDCQQDMSIFLCGALVPCLLGFQVAKDYGESLWSGCFIDCIVAMRTGIRERYKIEGSVCNDCLMTYFCFPCVLCQMARELQSRN